jgi:hypothetical protein
MSPTELRMQPTIHLERKVGYGRGKCPVLGTFQMYCGLHFQFRRVHYYS